MGTTARRQPLTPDPCAPATPRSRSLSGNRRGFAFSASLTPRGRTNDAENTEVPIAATRPESDGPRARSLHGFTTGVVAHDPDGAAVQRRSAYATPPSAFVDATTAQAEQGAPLYLDELAGCVARGDGMLFHDLLVRLARLQLIAWFARGGRWWPHEKRLTERLRRLGAADIAELESALWRGSLEDRLDAARAFVVGTRS